LQSELEKASEESLEEVLVASLEQKLAEQPLVPVLEESLEEESVASLEEVSVEPLDQQWEEGLVVV
jgi:hypothetical protein